jgi:hypothetical protein
MITVALLLVFIAVFAVAATWACRWIWREGFRQGDATNDVSTSVRAFGEGRYITVRTAIANPQPAPVITAVRFREVGDRMPISRQGRSTLRKRPDMDAAELRAVDAASREVLEQVVERPAPHRALVVDIYVWQQGERVRLHRHLCGPSQPDQSKPVAWQSVY